MNSTNGPAAGGTDAASDGSTLKATAPVPVSPINGDQPDTVVFVATKSTGKFADFNPSYEFQIRSGSTVAWDSGTVGASGNGPTQVQYTPDTSSLASETIYTWRARAVYQGAYGPWSSDATFKTSIGAFIRGNQLRDPLTNGSTVGQIVGPTQWTSEGLKLLANESHVTYQLPQTLTAGEFSMMIKGADEGGQGGKSKVFSMQQGFDDITTNAYRFTAELRGAAYPAPGSITCRMIAGDGVSRDCVRIQKNFDSSRWYFWKATWDEGGSFTLEVRLDGPAGAVIYSNTNPLHGHVYRPNPHILYLGAPVGRGGSLDATLPGGTYKDVYAGPGPRPNFPN